MKVLNPDGVTVEVEMGDERPVGGYLVTSYDEGSRTWRRQSTASPYVDGEFETAAALAGRVVTVSVFIQAANWAAVSVLHEALLDAVEVSGWWLEVNAGKTWLCRVADSASPMPPAGENSTWREVTLTIPVTQGRGI